MIAALKGGKGIPTLLCRAVLSLSLMIVSMGEALAGNDPIVFQSTDTPPFWAASLPDNGVGGAALRLLSEYAGVQYSIEYLPIKRFRNSLATYIVGDPDILLIQKRRAIFPIGIFQSAFFYYKPRHDRINFRNLSELRGQTMGVLRGTLEDSDYFVRRGINVEESDTIESLFKKLRKGRISFCIVVAGAGRYTIQQLFPKEQKSFVQETIPGSQRPIAAIIDMDSPDGRAVAQRYRQVIRQVLDSPKYQQILSRQYGEDNTPTDNRNHLDSFVKYYESTWGN